MYKIRINIYETKLGRRVYVRLAGDTYKMFPKPYVELRRIQDRIGFVPRDQQNNSGIVAIRENKLQFALETDCRKMEDFCGEYDEVNVTESGVVFLKLSDKKPYSQVRKPRLGMVCEKEHGRSFVENPVKPKELPEPTELAEMLEREVDRERGRRQGLEQRLVEIEAERKRIVEQINDADRKIAAYENAVGFARGIDGQSNV